MGGRGAENPRATDNPKPDLAATDCVVYDLLLPERTQLSAALSLLRHLGRRAARGGCGGSGARGRADGHPRRSSLGSSRQREPIGKFGPARSGPGWWKRWAQPKGSKMRRSPSPKRRPANRRIRARESTRARCRCAHGDASGAGQRSASGGAAHLHRLPSHRVLRTRVDRRAPPLASAPTRAERSSARSIDPHRRPAPKPWLDAFAPASTSCVSRLAMTKAKWTPPRRSFTSGSSGWARPSVRFSRPGGESPGGQSGAGREVPRRCRSRAGR